MRWATSNERKGGCIFAAAAFELDDHPGPARDFVAEQSKVLLSTLARTARLGVEVGAFRSDLDCEQLAFQMHAILLGFHHLRRLLRHRGAEEQARQAFERVLADAAPRN